MAFFCVCTRVQEMTMRKFTPLFEYLKRNVFVFRCWKTDSISEYGGHKGSW